MLESYLMKGLAVGLVFGVPAGAIGALTIQRALTRGFWAGLFTGFGSSMADVMYACVGICGLTAVSDFLLVRQTAISLVGGGGIVLFGIAMLQKKSGVINLSKPVAGLSACFCSSFAVAVANPATILSFFVAFASFGIGGTLSGMQGVFLATGILVGTSCWWTALSATASLFRRRITDRAYQILNWLLGGLMVLLGFIMVARALIIK